MAESQFVPDAVDYTEADTKRLSYMPTLKEGMYKVAVSKADRGAVGETNNLYINLTLVALDAADQPQKYTVRRRIELPLSNPAVPGGHAVAEADEVKDRFKKFVKAIDPQAFPRGPTKNDEGKYFDIEGQPMTREKWDAYNIKTNKILLDKAKTWYNDPASLKGAVCYAFVARNEQYANVKWLAATPGAYAVITENFTG